MYIYSSTSIDIKIKFEIPFHPNPRRITFPQSRNPLTSPPKKYEKTISNLLKNTTQKNIYMETIFIQKKERRKIQKNTIHPRSKPRFDNKKRKRTHSIMEDRQGESPVISLDSSETQSRMEIQPTPWAADSPSPTRSARACLTRDSARVSALDRSHPILHAGKRSIIGRTVVSWIRRFPCVSEDLTCVRAGWLSFRSIFRGKQVAGCMINLCFSLDLCRNKS